MTQSIIVESGVAPDTPTEESFERITAIALRLLDVPAAMITLVSDGRAYHRTRAGEIAVPDVAETYSPGSLCARVVERREAVVVHDLELDDADATEAVVPAGIRAFAGFPLQGRDGATLGALCVFSTQRRGWTATDLAGLESLARITVAEIELRTALDTAAEQAEALRTAHAVIREQAARQEAEAGRERIATILESITDAFFGLDADGRFSYVNGQMEVLLGRTRHALVGLSAWEELGLTDCADLRIALERAQNEGVAVGLETTLPHLGAWFQVHAYPSDGGVAVFLHDITERRAAVDQLRREALHDALTGLPNRIQFMQRLGRYVERSERRGRFGFAVLFIDLDRFKVINDSLGHVVGDELLVQIARRLESCLRPVDMVARFGGDEFAILLHDVDTAADAIHVAERIEAALHHPLSPAGYQVYTAASIGITLSSTGYTSREDVLRDADTAMYRAKASGVRYAVFDSTMHEHAVTRLHLESELRPALELEQLRLFYQPIVDLRTARLAGFEALLRWFHPHRGLLTPHEFVPLAEETGIIVPIGWWVLDEACRALVEWQRAVPGSKLRVNVNLSGRQLVQSDMVDRVDLMLDTHDIPPESLSLEITESVLMKNPEQVADTLRELKKRGVHLCIDDFGTGYSSFTYLHRFPVDTLKVDRTFVARLDHESGSHEIVQAIIGLAHSLGMEAIAEGIEEPEQLAALRPLRPPYAQGYFFGRPLDPAAALRLAKEGRTFF